MSDQILKAKQVAEMLDVGLSTVYRAVEAGELPAIRIGAAIRIRREALEKFLSQQESRGLGAVNAAPGVVLS